MAQASLSRVLAQIEALSPEERLQLRKQLDAVIPVSAAETANDANRRHEDAAERLRAKGVISRIPSAPPHAQGCHRRSRVRVVGQPLSRTVIEERR